LYLYFYGETRVDFREWLGDLRKLIWMRFFLYQVWARDRIRLHPKSCEMIGDCGHKLCCTQTLCRIDSIETKTVHLQNLQTQWIEKQKWVCGKLKCCLKYEEDIYLKELDNYPDIWAELEIEGKKYTVIGINTLSGYVFLKDEDWYIKRLPKEEISY
jgi:cell fate regulator YaaT (PSP1 superfamily)